MNEDPKVGDKVHLAEYGWFLECTVKRYSPSGRNMLISHGILDVRLAKTSGKWQEKPYGGKILDRMPFDERRAWLRNQSELRQINGSLNDLSWKPAGVDGELDRDAMLAEIERLKAVLSTAKAALEKL